MMEHIATHKEDALKRLLQQYKGKPNLAAFLSPFLRQIQDLEDALWQLFTERFIETAVGKQLDVLGKIVGQPRGSSADDAEYRQRLKARIRANQSSGTVPELYAVFFALLGSFSPLRYEPFFPAGFTLHIEDYPLDDATATLYASFLKDARLAGVEAQLETSAYDAAHTFTLATTTKLTSDQDAPGTGVLYVVSTEDFPDSGQAVLDISDPDLEEVVTYTSKTATTLEGVSAFLNSHSADALVGKFLAADQALSDTAFPATGGHLSNMVTA